MFSWQPNKGSKLKAGSRPRIFTDVSTLLLRGLERSKTRQTSWHSWADYYKQPYGCLTCRLLCVYPICSNHLRIGLCMLHAVFAAPVPASKWPVRIWYDALSSRGGPRRILSLCHSRCADQQVLLEHACYGWVAGLDMLWVLLEWRDLRLCEARALQLDLT